MNEEDIKGELTGKFPSLADKVRVQRARRIFIDVEYAKLRPVLEFAGQKLGFLHLSAITGLDEGTNLAAIYHLSSDDGVMLNVKTMVPKDDPRLQTVTGLYTCAEIYERELVDLLGFKVEGLTLANRYPLTDDWPADQFPLRKDWKKEVAKNG
jgi:Ni,Fe-hydrogenase III component G